MPFEDLVEFIDDTLPLPISGKTYRIPCPSAEVGLHCQLVVDIGRRVREGLEVSEADMAVLVLDDDQEKVFVRRMLGAALDEMIADGVSWNRALHAARTTMAWVVGGKANAERVWKRGDAAAGEAQPATRPAPQDHLPKKP